jgi:hypothetical protein
MKRKGRVQSAARMRTHTLTPHSIVMPREGGASSTWRLLGSSTATSGILDRPPESVIGRRVAPTQWRTMTAESCLTTESDLTLVVLAKARTHNHRPLLCASLSPLARATAPSCGYGSPPSRGRHGCEARETEGQRRVRRWPSCETTARLNTPARCRAASRARRRATGIPRCWCRRAGRCG